MIREHMGAILFKKRMEILDYVRPKRIGSDRTPAKLGPDIVC
jgi:hypothetical protein